MNDMNSLKSTTIKQPDAAPDLFCQYWNERDATKLAGLFYKDAHFVNVVGLWWSNRQDIWRAHDYGLREIFSQTHLSVRKKIVTQLTDDVVLVHTRMRLEGQTPQKQISQPGVRFTVFTFVLQKKSKGWTIVAAHNTDQVPHAETNIIDESGKINAVDYRNGDA